MYTKIKDLRSRKITSLPTCMRQFSHRRKHTACSSRDSFAYSKSRHDSYPQFPRSSLGRRGLQTTVSDKNSWYTLTKRCFFPSRAPLVPLKVVYRGLVTKSCTPTLRGQGDPKVSQPFWLRLCFWGILGMWLLVGSSGGKSLGRYMHVSEPFFREKH